MQSFPLRRYSPLCDSPLRDFDCIRINQCSRYKSYCVDFYACFRVPSAVYSVGSLWENCFIFLLLKHTSMGNYLSMVGTVGRQMKKRRSSILEKQTFWADEKSTQNSHTLVLKQFFHMVLVHFQFSASQK